jgi:hypothetical protein
MCDRTKKNRNYTFVYFFWFSFLYFWSDLVEITNSNRNTTLSLMILQNILKSILNPQIKILLQGSPKGLLGGGPFFKEFLV